MKKSPTIEKLKSTASEINATILEDGDFIFLNFSKNGLYEKAVKWGKDNGLALTVKEDIESYKDKDLPSLFDKSYGCLVETTGKLFDGDAGACCVWWSDSERESGLDWQSYFGSDDDWFAFRKSSSLESHPSSEPLPFEPSELKDRITALVPVLAITIKGEQVELVLKSEVLELLK